MLTDSSGRLLAINPEASFSGAPFAAERLGLNAASVARMAESGGAMRGAHLGDDARILGAASVNGVNLHALSLGPDGVNQAAWNRTLFFHLLLFLAPLGTALALSLLLQNQIGRLGDTQAKLHDSEGRLGLAIEGARCGVVFGAAAPPGAFNCTVGAGAAGLGALGAEPAALSGMVGAGAGGALGVGAAGASAVGASSPAFKVTRTVSFLSGTADVFFIGLGGLGGCLSSSLMAKNWMDR